MKKNDTHYEISKHPIIRELTEAHDALESLIALGLDSPNAQQSFDRLSLHLTESLEQVTQLMHAIVHHEARSFTKIVGYPVGMELAGSLILDAEPPKFSSETVAGQSKIKVPFVSEEDFRDLSFDAYLFEAPFYCPNCGSRLDDECVASVKQSGTCNSCQKEFNAVLVSEQFANLLHWEGERV